VQVSREASREDHMLEACHPFGDNEIVKTCLGEGIP
jgi:hypothetical protein